MKRRIAILISGRGSHMFNLIKASQDTDFGGKIVLVASNQPHAKGLAKAREMGVNAFFLGWKILKPV